MVLEYGIDQSQKAEGRLLSFLNEYKLSYLNVALIFCDYIDKFLSVAEINLILYGFIIKNISLGSSLEIGGNES